MESLKISKNEMLPLGEGDAPKLVGSIEDEQPDMGVARNGSPIGTLCDPYLLHGMA